MKLNFFTAGFPFGKHETFIENEINYASTNFDEVNIFPFSANEVEVRSVPINCKVNLVKSKSASSGILLKNGILVFRILVTEYYNTSSKRFFLKKLPMWISYIKKALVMAKDFENSYIQSKATKEETIYYSFWMNDWALVLAILKRKKKINNFIFRCGGFDIWNERHPGNYLPFRYFIYKESNYIFPNSKMGEIYLKKLNFLPNKIQCSYWGTPDFGLNTPGNANELTLVSCSSLISLKRVHLIAAALKQAKRKIRWIHFGDGELRSEIEAQIKKLPDNVLVTLMGNVPNSEVHSFYKSNTVDFFITTSETESLPVSIQEAISYGIPVIATNVGGISEMVNCETGYLIDKNFDLLTLTQLIDSIELSKWRNGDTRNAIRNFWNLNFNAAKVYPEFYSALKKL